MNNSKHDSIAGDIASDAERESATDELSWWSRPYYVRPSKSWPEQWVASAPGRFHVLMSGPRAEARAREYAALANVRASVDVQLLQCGDVTITGTSSMTIVEMWNAIKSAPAFRACLDAELRAMRVAHEGDA